MLFNNKKMSCGKKVQKIPPVNPVFMMEHRPRLNFKNKSFARWYRYEPFKHKDNIVSSEWSKSINFNKIVSNNHFNKKFFTPSRNT